MIMTSPFLNEFNPNSDVQDFAERLFRRCSKGTTASATSNAANRFAAADVRDVFDILPASRLGVNIPTRPLSFADRLLCFQLACRIVGIHKLLVLGVYSYCMKYAKPHQREVTQLLTSAIHATHDLTPPEHVSPLLRHIADNFISEKSSGAAMVVGLQAVRELCARCPTAIEGDLLRDLVAYKDFKKGEKGISMAAKGLLSLYERLIFISEPIMRVVYLYLAHASNTLIICTLVPSRQCLI